MTITKKIVIVDDEPKIVKALCDAFRFEEGYQIIGFTDGSEALHYLKTTPAPDLIILDWRLRGDVQGKDLLVFTKKHLSHVSVWVVTASIHFLEDIRIHQPSDIVMKPCQELVAKIRAL